MHDRKLNGCRQRLLFARQLIPRKCSLCSHAGYKEVQLFKQILSSSAHPVLKLCLFEEVKQRLYRLTCIPTTGAEGTVSFRGLWRKHVHSREDADHQDEGQFCLDCFVEYFNQPFICYIKKKITKKE